MMRSTVSENNNTLRFLHDLQFMDSRGSFVGRRAGSRSIPTCGRDMLGEVLLCGSKDATGGCLATEAVIPSRMGLLDVIIMAGQVD